VRGFIYQGSTTTPFDMVVLNNMSRFHLAIEALKYVSRLRSAASEAIDLFERRLAEHRIYIREQLEDLPDIANWRWTSDFSEPSGAVPPARGHSPDQLFSDA
jgi:xylulose-5-phosphate/fructose-6-phosphate phosphoketolase